MRTCSRCGQERKIRSDRTVCYRCTRRKATVRQVHDVPALPPNPVVVPPSGVKRCAFFPDLHFPWHSREKLFKALDLLHPGLDLVAQVGDLYDMHGFSKFPRSFRVMGPEEELTLARQYAEWFWGEVRSRAPNARCVQILGNHDDRPVKNALARAPELETLIGPAVRDLYTFEGVETLMDGTEHLEVNGAAVLHGYLTVPGAHCLAGNMPVVHGHDHKLYVVYKRSGLWEMSVGYLGDPKAPCFGYAAWKRAGNMQHGMGFLDEFGPRVVEL